MGLAEPKRKKKFTPSHLGGAPSDWTSDSASPSIAFKLMSSMGWTPGKGLGNDLQGEKDNIKVALKDDLLGLGAKKEYGGGLWRGTSEVDDLYRRLEVGAGAKSVEKEERVKVEEVKEEVKVRGGWKMRFLVGDTYTSSFSTEVSTEVSTAEVSEVEESGLSLVEESSGEVKESKKRKREEENGEKKKRSKKDKKQKKGKEQLENSVSETVSRTEEVRRKKGKLRSKTDTTTTNQEQDESPVANQSQVTPIKKDKKLKKEKKEKKPKKEKSSKKEKKEKTDNGDKKKRKDKSKGNGNATESLSASDSNTPAPIPETTLSVPEVDRSVPIPRHMHRARFLAMKRASVMDPNALREILGVSG